MSDIIDEEHRDFISVASIIEKGLANVGETVRIKYNGRVHKVGETAMVKSVFIAYSSLSQQKIPCYELEFPNDLTTYFAYLCDKI